MDDESWREREYRRLTVHGVIYTLQKHTLKTNARRRWVNFSMRSPPLTRREAGEDFGNIIPIGKLDKVS